MTTFCDRWVLSAVIIYILLSSADGDHNSNFTRKFDEDDEQLPVYKIYVHGQAVLVRQIFNHSDDNLPHPKHAKSSEYKINDILNDNLQCFSSSEYGMAPKTFANILNYNKGGDDNEVVWRRDKRFGFPPIVPPLPPAAPAVAPAYSVQPAQQYIQPQPQYQPQNIYVAESPRNPFISDSSLQSNSLLQFPPQQQQLPPPPPPPQSPEPQPIITPPSIIRPESTSHPNYPLPECYTNDNNFMCCNRDLEQILRDTFRNLIGEGCNVCNVNKITNTIQEEAENEFKTNFEVISGLGDFASKSHFYGNYICKVEEQGRFILAYATPKPEVEDYLPHPPSAGVQSSPILSQGLQVPHAQILYNENDVQQSQSQSSGYSNSGGSPQSSYDSVRPDGNHEDGYRRRNSIYIWQK